MTKRKASASGSFYPGTREEITKLLDRIILEEKKKIAPFPAGRKVIGAVVPHAGYIYSGYEAVHFFENLRELSDKYETILIINPNHTGYGSEIEVDGHDQWETPLGKIEPDRDFAAALGFNISQSAQRFEHSAEVMLPFLQYTLPYAFRIVAVSMLKQEPDISGDLARAILKANRELKRRILIIASSDFSHYVEPEYGRAMDNLALRKIEELDPGGLYKTVVENEISICGFGPIMTLMEYVKMVSDDPRATVLARGNSGKTVASDSVVDYVTLLFTGGS